MLGMAITVPAVSPVSIPY